MKCKHESCISSNMDHFEDLELDDYRMKDIESSPIEPSYPLCRRGDSIMITYESRIHDPCGQPDDHVDAHGAHITLKGPDDSVILKKSLMNRYENGLHSFSFRIDVPNGLYRALAVAHYDGWDRTCETSFEVAS